MSPAKIDDVLDRFDINRDGSLTEDEIKRSTEILELELREEKSEAQKRMAWVAIGSMIVYTGVLFSPIMTIERVNALSDLLGMFYIAQTGVVGAYMGVTAWLSKK